MRKITISLNDNAPGYAEDVLCDMLAAHRWVADARAECAESAERQPQQAAEPCNRLFKVGDRVRVLRLDVLSTWEMQGQRKGFVGKIGKVVRAEKHTCTVVLDSVPERLGYRFYDSSLEKINEAIEGPCGQEECGK